MPVIGDDEEERGRIPGIRACGDHIWYYAEVGADEVALLAALMQSLQGPKPKKKPPIFLHVNSLGGSLYDGLAALATVRASKRTIYTVVEGAVASAATFLTIGARRRLMAREGRMLVHQARHSLEDTTSREFADEARNVRELDRAMVDAYTTYTAMSKRKARYWLNRERWLTAAKCLELGLVDEVI